MINTNNYELLVGEVDDEFDLNLDLPSLTQYIAEGYAVNNPSTTESKGAIEDSSILDDSFEDEEGSLASGTAQFVALGLPHLSIYGNKHHMWLSFLAGFASSKIYENRVNHFLLFHSESPDNNGTDSAAMEVSLMR